MLWMLDPTDVPPHSGARRNPLVDPGAQPRPAGPVLPGTVVLRPSMEELSDVLLMDMLLHSQNCVRAFGDFHLAISASERVEPLLIRLMLDPAYRLLPWKRTHLWSIDDCNVDVDDDRSRAKRMREILVEHSDIPVDQVHGIMVSADDPGGEYQDELREALGWREKGQDRLDFALLALADGGPISETLAGRHAAGVVSAGDLVTRTPWRDRAGLEWFSLSSRMISASRFIAVLASGESARGDVAAVAEARRIGGPHAGIGGIKPIGGELRWYLDEPACGQPGGPGTGVVGPGDSP